MSITPDLICAWPVHLDFPLWRQYIHDNRSRFGKIIIVMTNMKTGRDYRDWLIPELNRDSIVGISSDEVLGGEDWRDVAVKKGLGFVDGKWIFFTEEDFFPQRNFWDIVNILSQETDAFGYFQEGRLHPCCIFIKKITYDRLRSSFAVVKDKMDHFGQLQADLNSNDIPIGVIPKEYGHHLNGLSQNMYLLQIGQEPNYEPEKFKEYCRMSLQVDLPIQPQIKKLMEDYVR